MGRRFRGNTNFRNKFVRVLPDDTLIDHTPGDDRGIFFRSQKEAKRFVYLRQLEREGTVTLLQRQVPFPLAGRSPVTGQLVHMGDYVCDFMYARDGRIVVEDVKGVVTDEYRLKRQLMLFLYGIAILET